MTLEEILKRTLERLLNQRETVRLYRDHLNGRWMVRRSVPGRRGPGDVLANTHAFETALREYLAHAGEGDASK